MTLLDLHSYQLTGTYCGGKNCAACSGAAGLHAGSGGRISITGDQFRAISGVSCIPGDDTRSGGLTITDVARVFRHYGVPIDYGIDPERRTITRWSAAEGWRRVTSRYGAIFLGDYDALPSQYRATSFLGDHSVWAHDGRSDNTVCWHDPLRRSRLRVPWSVLVRYWWKSTSPVRGYAGWVKDTRPNASTEDKLVVVIRQDFCEGERTVNIAAGTYIPGGYAFNSDGTLRRVVGPRTWTTASSARAAGTVDLSTGRYLWMVSGTYAPDGKSSLIKVKSGISY